jgi:hypothetical protein
MPDKMVNRIIRTVKVDPNKSETMDFDEVYKVVLAQIQSTDIIEVFRNPI